MRKPEQKTNRGTGGLRARIGTKLLAGVATFSLVASMCPGAAALSYAGDQLAAGSAGLEAQASSTEPKPLKDWDTGYELYTGTWIVTEDLTIKENTKDWSALYVKPGADVTLIIDKGATLDVEGGPCTAAIYLPYGSTLTIAGEGTLKAKGGDASTPEGEFLGAVESDELDDYYLYITQASDIDHGETIYRFVLDGDIPDGMYTAFIVSERNSLGSYMLGTEL